MADRTSAEVFAAVFGLAAEMMPPDSVRDRFVRRIWGLSRGYDFNPCQMDCDDDLIALGLARRGIDPKHPDEGECTLYEPYPKGATR